MSESIRPWIKEYFIQVAETHGGNLSAVPLEEKGKKVQIAEFLTFGAENEDSAVWALLHDKFFTVPVKFSKESVVECTKNFGRLTETKSIVTIKKFKAMSTRIPQRNRGMSSESHLALHCESVSVVGSLGQGKFGNPKDLESDTDLREWSHALRQDGGAGNVLKERKKAREGGNNVEPARPAKHVSPRKPLPVTKPKAQVVRSPMHEYNKRWRDSFDTLDFVRPRPRSLTPTRPESPEDARDLGSSSPSEKYSDSSSPFSGWSLTPAKSDPRKQKVDSPATPSPCPPKESSYLTAPTPAQRRQHSPMPSPGLLERKVARPPPPPSPVRSGPERILAPNSDTSQSQSQSQPSQASLSQPQPQLTQPPSQQSVTLTQPARVMDEDDAQTDDRLFRRGSPLERAGPAKKRRRLNENEIPGGHGKLKGFVLGLDNVEARSSAVGWDRVYTVLKRI